MILGDFGGDVLCEFRKLAHFLDVFIGLNAFVRFVIRRPKVIECSTQSVLVNLFLSLICIGVSIVISIVGFALTVLLIIYKIFIILLLRIKYKENYGGLLQGADSLWVAEDETSRNIINLVFLLQFNKEKDSLLDYVREICEQRFLKSARLTCVRRQFMGYMCFIKNQLLVDDVVKAMKFSNGDVCDSESLQKFVQTYSNRPLPLDDSAAWELIVGEEPVRLKGLENEGEQYPLLIRVHHTVGDGITLFSLLIQAISDEGSSILEKPEEKIEESLVERFVSWMRNFPTKVKGIFTEYAYIFMSVVPPDRNALHVPRLSGEKRIGFYIENKPHYVEKVKRIKNVLGGTFSDVLFTTVSASLNDYFKKNSNDVPSYITLTFMTLPNKGDVRYTHEKLGNIFSMGSIQLPIDVDEASLIERYVRTKEEYKKCNDSYDIWMYYWQLQLFTNILPVPIARRMVKLNTMTTVSFSNLPGFKKIHISRRALNHVLFWLPNFINVGVGFSVITYDGRFQMGLLVDKLLVSDEKEVQQILDDVFKYIDLLGQEVERRQNI